MTHVILTCNAGSTNTKLAVFDAETLERKGHIQTHSEAETLAWLCSVGQDGVAGMVHRVVHGGRDFIHPTLITGAVIDQLRHYIPLAPLHQPASLKLIEESRRLYGNIPHIACFDTAFHHTLPEIERRLPLPQAFHDKGIMRYGFHGLSYEHISTVLPEYVGEKANGRIIVAHLGGGSSACALKNGQSIASTMGFSTLDGLMMGTRCGALDSGVILHLMQEENMPVKDVANLLYHESGLKGVSGISGDLRELQANSSVEARTAIELYCYLAARQISGLLPALGGLDALVFTGGIGENNAAIREKISAYLSWIGTFPVYTIPTNEEAVMAKACAAHLKETVQ